MQKIKDECVVHSSEKCHLVCGTSVCGTSREVSVCTLEEPATWLAFCELDKEGHATHAGVGLL